MSLDPKTLFVKNIKYDTTAEGLKAVFEKYGPLQRPRILTERWKGKVWSRGMGFVEFDTPEGLQAALKDKDNLSCDGRKLVVNQARPRVQRRRDTIFIGRLPEGCTVDDLKAAVSKYNPLDAKVVYPTGGRPGFGFVKMATPEDQEKAVKENRRVTIKGAECIVMFAKAQFDAPPRRRMRRFSRRAPRQAPAQGAQGTQN